MVTKSKKVSAKKSRVKVGKLKLNNERIKDLSGGEKREVKGGLRATQETFKPGR